MDNAQSPDIITFIATSAGILAPWRVTHWHCDESAQKIHIWVTRLPLPEMVIKRNWLGKITSITSTHAELNTLPASASHMHWQHVSCFDFSCTIHTEDILKTQHIELPWFGQADLPFTNRLAQQVFSCMMEGMELSAICSLYSLSFADLWKFKFAIDKGQVTINYTPFKRTPTASKNSSLSEAISRGIPLLADAVWEKLIKGELSIQTSTLSFQLILTKIRLQVSMQKSDDMKSLKLRELHRYVERNERSLTEELRQIRAYSQHTAEQLN
jgi:hypothetical protein